ncbi:MAG: tRNA (adenosine(37)-N6)-dimethylallyltransferase MiaA [Candidatus Wildermuthbacteria bacterium]|nr:tRNA (adenosine(37)-N6)-dimethylallyltransferase MiaA [Candidatus Wildermuthbacteria bacterium]
MLIVVLGPTASGKSALAVKIAKKFGGEIISADSRQVYKGLEIGSGQIPKKEMMGVPHHLLGIASPKRRYTVAQYRIQALSAIRKVLRKRKLPILVGGTPFYIYAVVDGWMIPEVKPNSLLRKSLEKLSIQELFAKLKKLDPKRAKTIEAKNKRRLVRALEIILTTGKPVPELKKHPLPYPVTFLGLKKSPEALRKLIKKRFLAMLKKGLLTEVKKLRDSGLSWQRIESFGLEYREVSQYLQGKLSQAQMIEQTVKATEDFARRQMTWFKKDSRIHWIKDSKAALAFLAGRAIMHFVRSKWLQ